MKKQFFIWLVIILGVISLAFAPAVQVPARPIIRLNVGNQTAEEAIYAYCWPAASRNNQCNFTANPPLVAPLQIEDGQQVTVLVEGDAPNRLVLSRVITDEVVESVDLPNPQQAIFDANYGVGSHIVQLDALYDNIAGVPAFVSYRFALNILPVGMVTEIAQITPTTETASGETPTGEGIAATVEVVDVATEESATETATKESPSETPTVEVTATNTKQPASASPTLEAVETEEIVETEESAVLPTQEVLETVEVVETEEATQEVVETVEVAETEDTAVLPTEEVLETAEVTDEPTQEVTEEPTATTRPSNTPTDEPTATPTETDLPTETATNTASATATNTATVTNTATTTLTPSATGTATTVALGGTPLPTTEPTETIQPTNTTAPTVATATTVGIAVQPTIETLITATSAGVQPSATSPIAQPAEPPAVVLVFAGQTYQPVGVNFCQTSESGELICVNRPLESEGDAVQLLQDFAIQVRLPADSPRPQAINFDFLDPNTLQAFQSDVRRGDRLVLFNIEVNAGTYFLRVSIDWGTTQAEYFFRVRVS